MRRQQTALGYQRCSRPRRPRALSASPTRPSLTCLLTFSSARVSSLTLVSSACLYFSSAWLSSACRHTGREGYAWLGPVVSMQEAQHAED